jgi:hypothetical protein
MEQRAWRRKGTLASFKADHLSGVVAQLPWNFFVDEHLNCDFLLAQSGVTLPSEDEHRASVEYRFNYSSLEGCRDTPRLDDDRVAVRKQIFHGFAEEKECFLRECFSPVVGQYVEFILSRNKFHPRALNLTGPGGAPLRFDRSLGINDDYLDRYIAQHQSYFFQASRRRERRSKLDVDDTIECSTP